MQIRCAINRVVGEIVVGIVVSRVDIVDETAALGARLQRVEHLAHRNEVTVYDDRVG